MLNETFSVIFKHCESTYFLAGKFKQQRQNRHAFRHYKLPIVFYPKAKLVYKQTLQTRKQHSCVLFQKEFSLLDAVLFLHSMMGRVRVPKRKKKTNWKATNLTSKFSDFSLESSDFSSSGHSSLCRSIEWDPYHHSIRMRCFLYLSDARAISFRCQCQNLHQFAITEQKLFHFWTFWRNFLFDMIIRSDGQLI